MEIFSVIFSFFSIFSFHFFFFLFLIFISARMILFLSVFVVLFVCEQLYAKTYEQISMKFSGSVGGGPRRNRLDFGSYR